MNVVTLTVLQNVEQRLRDGVVHLRQFHELFVESWQDPIEPDRFGDVRDCGIEGLAQEMRLLRGIEDLEIRV